MWKLGCGSHERGLKVRLKVTLLVSSVIDQTRSKPEQTVTTGQHFAKIRNKEVIVVVVIEL